MKKWKQQTIVRAFNAGAKIAEGCQSAECVFGVDGERKTIDRPCDCAEKMRGVLNQIERDLKKEGI